MPTRTSEYKSQLVRELKSVPEEYLPDLLMIVRLFRESVSLKNAEESFRQGWKEALEGETYPISELWDGIDAE